MNKTFLKLLLPTVVAFSSSAWGGPVTDGQLLTGNTFLTISKSVIMADMQDDARITAKFLSHSYTPIDNIISTGGIWLLKEENGALVDTETPADASQIDPGKYSFILKNDKPGLVSYKIKATADDEKGVSHTITVPDGSLDILYLGKVTEQTHFESAHPYANGTDVSKTLSIPGAEHIYMGLRGEIAKGDYVSVNGVRYSGVVDEILDITGESAEVRFYSDADTTDSGITVDIVDADPSSVESNTHFETAHPYANYTSMSDTLTIPGAAGLTLTLTGETEKNYDFVYINGERYDGVLNKTIEIDGDSVEVRFTSDYSVTKSGVTIDIEEK